MIDSLAADAICQRLHGGWFGLFKFGVEWSGVVREGVQILGSAWAVLYNKQIQFSALPLANISLLVSQKLRKWAGLPHFVNLNTTIDFSKVT